MDTDYFFSEEPLTGELRLGVKSQLEDYWYFHRRQVVFRRNVKSIWFHTGYQRTLRGSPPYLPPGRIHEICNKPTILCVAQSGQQYNNIPMLIFACIYDQWFLHYNNVPNVEFGHFFTDPVRITPNGPKTVVEIVRSHKLLCEQASQLLERLGRGEEIYSGITRSFEDYKLIPLSRAIILILDELSEHVEEDVDGYISLDVFSEAQTVLMVRTGDESHLSAPISFEQIKSKTFPLNRDDCAVEGIEVVRVSLKTAVRFIADLERREEVAFPSGNNGHVVEKYLCPEGYNNNSALSAESWAEDILQKADEDGMENEYYARDALESALAARRGDESEMFTPVPFNRRWKEVSCSAGRNGSYHFSAPVDFKIAS